MTELKLSEQEIEDDFRYAETVERDVFQSCYTRIEDLVGIIHSHFKFGYGGFNGRFQNWAELERLVKEFIKLYEESPKDGAEGKE